MKRIFFIMSVDCDLRISSVMTRDASLTALVEAFKRSGIAGHVTWFLNENDFALTRDHTGFIETVSALGDAVGVHDHIDYLKGRWEYDAIYPFCLKSLNRVRSFLGKDRIMAHRFGCLFQHPAAYKVLADLGYVISSDVSPETIHHNHTGELAFDNRDVPLGVLPYRHDEATINDYRGRTGRFAQFPMLKACLNGGWGPVLGREVVDPWIAAAERRGQDRCVLTFGFHPYEIVAPGKLDIDPAAVARLEEIVALMKKDYQAQFVNMEEYYRKEMQP